MKSLLFNHLTDYEEKDIEEVVLKEEMSNRVEEVRMRELDRSFAMEVDIGEVVQTDR